MYAYLNYTVRLASLYFVLGTPSLIMFFLPLNRTFIQPLVDRLVPRVSGNLLQYSTYSYWKDNLLLKDAYNLYSHVKFYAFRPGPRHGLSKASTKKGGSVVTPHTFSLKSVKCICTSSARAKGSSR